MRLFIFGLVLIIVGIGLWFTLRFNQLNQQLFPVASPITSAVVNPNTAVILSAGPSPKIN